MRLLLVDGHYYLYRSFFAIRGLANSKGEPTNAIYGFLKALRKMRADVQPDRAAVIWDCGLPARRTELQPEYKQNRSEMPEDLRPQEEWLQTNVALLGYPSLFLPNTEADDLIASYTRMAESAGWDVVIATNDKDIFQLTGEKVKIYSSFKDTFSLLGTEEVREKWGVEPAQIAEVLALTGDSSDNIPGVPGVGPKTAADLIRKHGSVSAILANPEQVANPRLREKLVTAGGKIAANRQMVELDQDLALPAPLDDLRIAPLYDKLLPALRACEFKGLLKEIEAEAVASTTPSQGELL